MADVPDALQRLIDARDEFTRAAGFTPTKVRLPIGEAWKIAKCKPERLGPFAAEIASHGLAALETHGVAGLQVVVVRGAGAIQFE